VRTIVQTFEVLLESIDGLVTRLIVFALLLMTALLFFNSIGRSILNVSFVGGPALGRFLIIWLTFLGSYLAARSGSHITVDVLSRALPEHIVRLIPIPVGLIGAITTTYIAWLGAVFTWTRFSAGQIDPMLEIPTGYFYLPVPIGSTLMALAFLQIALKTIVEVTGDTDSNASPDAGQP